MTPSATTSSGQDGTAVLTESPVRPQTPTDSGATSGSGGSVVVTTAPTASTATASTGTGAAGGLSDVFVGATAVDPAKFPGIVSDVGFQSPSGNINCGYLPDGLTCQISEFTYKPPDLDCHGMGAPGATFGIDRMGDSFLFCAGDVEGGGPVLAYGKQIAVGNVHCVSREDGVTCQDVSSGHGFKVSRAAYQLY